ncbi:MAG: imidazole glycerol phosphate synthase subunit HisH [Chloroflexota bacterium]
MQLAVVDYGAGNLRSVAKAFAYVGLTPTVTSVPAEVLAADAVVLPGVGAAGDAMRSLRRLGLVEVLRAFVASGRPFLGVCLGMQVLLTVSDEGGEQPCLNLVPGRVRLLPPGLKVPHMGWNQVRLRHEHPLFAGIPDDANFYFVHSYYCDPSDADSVLGETEYGLNFCSALTRANVVGTQFHPEKSGDPGLQVYRNFLVWAGLV